MSTNNSDSKWPMMQESEGRKTKSEEREGDKKECERPLSRKRDKDGTRVYSDWVLRLIVLSATARWGDGVHGYGHGHGAAGREEKPRPKDQKGDRRAIFTSRRICLLLQISKNSRTSWVRLVF